MPIIKSVVIGGDFNTNHDQAMFATESTLIPSLMLDTGAVLKDYLYRNE
jgi:hypothetical protein